MGMVLYGDLIQFILFQVSLILFASYSPYLYVPLSRNYLKLYDPVAITQYIQ